MSEKSLLWLKHKLSAPCGNGVEKVVNGALFPCRYKIYVELRWLNSTYLDERHWGVGGKGQSERLQAGGSHLVEPRGWRRNGRQTWTLHAFDKLRKFSNRVTKHLWNSDLPDINAFLTQCPSRDLLKNTSVIRKWIDMLFEWWVGVNESSIFTKLTRPDHLGPSEKC